MLFASEQPQVKFELRVTGESDETRHVTSHDLHVIGPPLEEKVHMAAKTSVILMGLRYSANVFDRSSHEGCSKQRELQVKPLQQHR